jgi:hypothetical protein
MKKVETLKILRHTGRDYQMLIIIITITKAMSSYGRIIGFDNISSRCSGLGHINFLIGTGHKAQQIH